jgi:hypothetical protein
MTDHAWQGGLVRIGAVDATAPERLLVAQMAASRRE